MDNLDQRGTNAADSAPGVDDGAARNALPNHMNKPGGRAGVWIWIAVSVVILAAIFVSRPLSNSRSGRQMVEPGTTQAEIARSNAPGTADRNEARRP